MKQLSLTQEYLLCVLNKNGKLSAFDLQKILCLSAAGVLELLLDDVFVLDGKKLKVRSSLPEEKRFLLPVYEIVEKKQPVKFESVVEHFSVSLSDKPIRELTESIGDALVQAGCAQKEKRGLFGGKDVFLPDEAAVDAIVQSIRAELLENGALSEDVIALTALLNKSGDLQKYFSAYEKKDLKKRLKEIKEDPQNEMIQKAVDYVETLFLMVVVAAT